MVFNCGHVLVILLVATVASCEDYCKVCAKHTMCKYKGYGSACKGKPTSGVDDDTKNLILKAHNAIRRQVASGTKQQPPAANMMKLAWDNRLAAVAQRWADQCTPQHDECRNDPRFKVGQNIFIGIDDDDSVSTGWTLATRTWFSEVKDFKPENINPFNRIKGTGHYSQMVWANTKFIGCGYSATKNSKMYVCNYGPVGNVKKGAMYKKGPACSSCPKGTSCHNGLCA